MARFCYLSSYDRDISRSTQAIETARDNAHRAAAYARRGTLEVVVNGVLAGSAANWKAWFDPATADFRKAVERDSRFYLAWDMLGLIHETTGELDQAISEYSQEMR